MPEFATSFLRVQTSAPSASCPKIALWTAALARGEEQAFREFYIEYAGRLLRYAITVAHGEMVLAEEAVQLALGRIAAKVRVFEEEEAFWAWLARVVRSCVIDGARRQGRHSALLERLRNEPATGSASMSDGEPWAGYLREAMALLEPEERELLETRYDEDISINELAARAGCSPKAMESRLARLRQRLRDLVSQRLRHET